MKSQSINKTRKKAFNLLSPSINNTTQNIPTMTCVGSHKTHGKSAMSTTRHLKIKKIMHVRHEISESRTNFSLVFFIMFGNTSIINWCQNRNTTFRHYLKTIHFSHGISTEDKRLTPFVIYKTRYSRKACCGRSTLLKGHWLPKNLLIIKGGVFFIFLLFLIDFHLPKISSPTSTPTSYTSTCSWDKCF